MAPGGTIRPSCPSPIELPVSADAPIQTEARQPVPLFQLIPRGDTPRGDDVRAVSPAAEQRRGPAV